MPTDNHHKQRSGDIAVVFTCGIIFSVLVGMWIGEWLVRKDFAANCIAQPGETLVATYPRKEGIMCGFNNSYGKAIKWRPASK